MNYFVKDKDGKYIEIAIHVHPKKLIIKVDGASKLYSHDDLWHAINNIRKYFSDNTIDSVIDNIFANYLDSNIIIPFGKVSNDDDDNQLSLF